MWGKTQVSFGTFGIYEQTNITVFAMTVAGSSAIPWRPPEAALYLGVIELCTSRLLFQSHDTLPPIILVAEPLGLGLGMVLGPKNGEKGPNMQGLLQPLEAGLLLSTGEETASDETVVFACL